MAEETNGFGRARRADCMTIEEAALACGVTRQTYRQREIRQEDFRLGELIGLKKKMGPTGQKLLFDAITSLFLPDGLRLTQNLEMSDAPAPVLTSENTTALA